MKASRLIWNETRVGEKELCLIYLWSKLAVVTLVPRRSWASMCRIFSCKCKRCPNEIEPRVPDRKKIYPLWWNNHWNEWLLARMSCKSPVWAPPTTMGHRSIWVHSRIRICFSRIELANVRLAVVEVDSQTEIRPLPPINEPIEIVAVDDNDAEIGETIRMVAITTITETIRIEMKVVTMPKTKMQSSRLRSQSNNRATITTIIEIRDIIEIIVVGDETIEIIIISIKSTKIVCKSSWLGN